MRGCFSTTGRNTLGPTTHSTLLCLSYLSGHEVDLLLLLGLLLATSLSPAFLLSFFILVFCFVFFASFTLLALVVAIVAVSAQVGSAHDLFEYVIEHLFDAVRREGRYFLQVDLVVGVERIELF